MDPQEPETVCVVSHERTTFLVVVRDEGMYRLLRGELFQDRDWCELVQLAVSRVLQVWSDGYVFGRDYKLLHWGRSAAYYRGQEFAVEEPSQFHIGLSRVIDGTCDYELTWSMADPAFYARQLAHPLEGLMQACHLTGDQRTAALAEDLLRRIRTGYSD